MRPDSLVVVVVAEAEEKRKNHHYMIHIQCKNQTRIKIERSRQLAVRVSFLNIWFSGATGERKKETQSDEQPAQAELLPKLIIHNFSFLKVL